MKYIEVFDKYVKLLEESSKEYGEEE